MLNGSALLRVFLVVIAAAVLTGLVQHYWIFDNGPAEPPATVARPSVPSTPQRRAEPTPAPQSVRAASDPQPAPAPQPPAPTFTAPAPNPAPVAPAEMQGAAAAASPPPAAQPPRQPPPRDPAPKPAAAAERESAEAEIAAAEASEARAVDLIDLNTGSLSELNGLKGGGAIGRAIIQRRPYTSIDQLLSKRVLSRTIYQRIKDQVTVR